MTKKVLLLGLRNYEPHDWSRAIRQARRSGLGNGG